VYGRRGTGRRSSATVAPSASTGSTTARITAAASSTAVATPAARIASAAGRVSPASASASPVVAASARIGRAIGDASAIVAAAAVIPEGATHAHARALAAHQELLEEAVGLAADVRSARERADRFREELAKAAHRADERHARDEARARTDDTAQYVPCECTDTQGAGGMCLDEVRGSHRLLGILSADCARVQVRF
jgi:hypothetical protein